MLKMFSKAKVVNHILSIHKKYKKILEYSREKPDLRIIDKKKLTNISCDTVFEVQFVNKNLVINLTAKEILDNNLLFNKLSAIDRAKVIYAANEGQKNYCFSNFINALDANINCKIISITSDKLKDMQVMTVQFELSGILFTQDIPLSSINKKILCHLSHQEAFMLGSLLTTEKIKKEESIIETLTTNNLID